MAVLFYFHKITSLRRNPCWKLWSPAPITAFSFVPRKWIEKSSECNAFLRTHRHSDASVQHNWQNIYHGTPQFLSPQKGVQATEKENTSFRQHGCLEGTRTPLLHFPLRLLHPQFKSTDRLRAQRHLASPKLAPLSLTLVSFCKK